MKFQLIALMLLLPLFLLGQPELKKITEKSKDGKTVEKYYVLKSDKKTKHGEYTSYIHGTLCVIGIYDNNQKTIFKYYTDNKLTLEYDFRNKQVINFDIEPYYLFINTPNQEHYERPAIPICSDSEILWFIGKNTKYPEEAIEKEISGQSIIGININNEGKIIDHILHKSSHPLLDAEAMRVIKSLQKEFEWLPAIKDGQPSSYLLILPVNFKLMRR